MKKVSIKFKPLLALFLALSTISCNQSTQQTQSKDLTSVQKAEKFSEFLGLGWNLGNNMDAYEPRESELPISEETLWGNEKATQQTFNNVKKLGFKSVRIPITWLGHIGEAPDYKIDEIFLNRVAELVNFAKNAGLNTIINIHHDGYSSRFWLNINKAVADSIENENIKNKISSVWKQIAEKFKNEGEYLIFEAFNEIQDGKWGSGDNLTDGGKQYNILNEWNQVFVDAVRSVGGENSNRYLGVPAYSTSPNLAKFLVLPKDNVEGKIAVSVHCYDPFLYCIEAKFSQWGHTAIDSLSFNNHNEKVLEETFAQLNSDFIQKGIPVYLGEFGNVNREDSVEFLFQKYYLEYFCRLANIYHISPFYWDNGYCKTGNDQFGLLNHSNGEPQGYGSELIDLMKNAFYNSDTTYSLISIYNKAPNF
ncbi:MAG: glycoside hydrolase family 5 protein [Bacteroidales bacterium]|nr:glycoside hydrolase family 5 protein [Bacteroidales bacterium]